jgi:hypothetical protein
MGMIYRFNCHRCGHEWASKQDRPRVCPKCKNPYWDIPKDEGIVVRTINTEFFKEGDIALKTKLKQNKWGRWKYNPATHCLEIEKQEGGYISHYEVDLDRCNTGAELLDWIYQVKDKNWISPDDVADLVYAVDDILESVQGTLCSGGENLKFDVNKYLTENVDPLFKRRHA